jgi:hypothetical protein
MIFKQCKFQILFKSFSSRVIYRVKFSAAAVTNVLTDSLAQLVLKAFRQYFIKPKTWPIFKENKFKHFLKEIEMLNI